MLLLFPLIILFPTFSAQNLTLRSFNSDCGSVFTQTQFVIESSGYPSNYPLNYECSYLLKGPNCPTYFTLQFLDFNVAESLGCAKDRLEIDNQDALCGNKNNAVEKYFSPKGTLALKFISDRNVTGRGYRILVTRSECLKEHPETTTITTSKIPKWYTTNKDVEYTTTTRPPIYSSDSNKCCQDYYSAKTITLTSPNFPYSMSSSANCTFKIYKFRANVCRLRIQVDFFWLGRPSTQCPEGFLQIDGQLICGCKSDLRLVSPFEGSAPKTLRFVSQGLETVSYSGFILNIQQDECPKRYVPEEKEKEKEAKHESPDKNFRFYNDQLNRVVWPKPRKSSAIFAKASLVHENKTRSANSVKHFYFFDAPDYNQIEARDREETTYVDTSNMSSVLQDGYDYGFCEKWNQQQFNALSMQKLPSCQLESNSLSKKCVDLGHTRGYFQSPGYPHYYPGNLNICYRFRKSPGYCAIRVYMKDFNTQPSSSCQKDYLLFGNQYRYCGNRLHNTVSTLDLTNRPHEEVNFVSDAFYCGRGFFGTYEQIACQEATNPINTSPRTPQVPNRPCSRRIQEEVFTVDVYDYNGPTCSFAIYKYAQAVCKVRLYFERFNLVCASEGLVVDGTMYCGNLAGQRVEVPIRDNGVSIIYRKRSNDNVRGLRLRITGQQIECGQGPVDSAPGQFLPSKVNETEEESAKFLLKFDKRFKDICGVITNSTESELPESFCDFIMSKNSNITKCLPISENSLIVPLETQHLELKIRNASNTLRDIEFEVVDCDDF